jgi:methylase of polypeptide subunit release factors
MTSNAVDYKTIKNPQKLDNGTIVEYSFKNTSFILESNRKVWAPTRFSLELCKVLDEMDLKQKTVIDFASGSGILGIMSALKGASKVIFVDLNPHAIKMSQKNWRLNNLPKNKIKTYTSNCFDIFDDRKQVPQADLILSNPPTAPAPEILEESTLPQNATEWNAFKNGDGRLVTDALINRSKGFLKTNGELLFVTTSKQGTLRTMQLLNDAFGKGIVKTKQKDPLNYTDTESKSFNWKVIKTLDLKLDEWYFQYLHIYKEINQQRNDLPPVFKDKDNKLNQRLYFIRAKNNLI